MAKESKKGDVGETIKGGVDDDDDDEEEEDMEDADADDLAVEIEDIVIDELGNIVEEEQAAEAVSAMLMYQQTNGDTRTISKITPS